MQSGNDAELSTAIFAVRRTPVLQALADWAGNRGYTHAESDLSPLVDSFEVERALVTDLPAECSLLDGHVISKATVRLSGRRRDARLNIAQVLAPARADSPLYNVPKLGSWLRLALGFAGASGPKTVPQFVGPISDIKPRQDGTAEIEALDPVDQLRAAITLPTWAQYAITYGKLLRLYDINTQWIVDFVLRRNGIYPSPPFRSDAVIAVTGHGGLVSEVGFSGPPLGDMRGGGAGMPQGGKSGYGFDTGGPYGLMCVWGRYGWGGYCAHYSAPAFQAVGGTGVGMSFWAWTGAGSAAAHGAPGGTGRRDQFGAYPTLVGTGERQGFRIYMLADGRVFANVRGSDAFSTGLTLPTTTGADAWRCIDFHFRVNATAGSITITARYDGQTYTHTTGAVGFSGGWARQLQFNNFTNMFWALFQGWIAPNPPAAGQWPSDRAVGFVSQADLDAGYNHFQYLPDVTGQDSFSVIDEVVSAEFGTCGMDEVGRFFFRAHASGSTASVRSLRARRELLAFETPTNLASVRNVVIAKARGGMYYVQSGMIDVADPEQIIIPPGVSSIVVPIPEYTAPPLGAQVTGYSIDAWRANKSTILIGFCAIQLNGSAQVTGISCFVEQETARSVRLVFNNTSGQTACAAIPPGPGQFEDEYEGALKVWGYKLMDHDAVPIEKRHAASIARYRERPLDFEESHWRQSSESLEAVADVLLSSLAYPVPTLDGIEIISDPRLQLGDVVTLSDPQGLASVDIRARIVKIVRKVSREGAVTETLAVRPLPATWPAA